MTTNSNSIGREGRFKDLAWWHGALIDWMLLNPDKIMRDAAKHFNVSENYISLLTGSDTFKLAYEKRRDQLIGEVQRTTVERLRGLTDNTLDALNERIARERDSMSIVDLRETCEMVLKASGYGQPKDARAGPQVTNNVIVVTAEDLAHARELMQARRKAVEVVDVSPSAALAATGL